MENQMEMTMENYMGSGLAKGRIEIVTKIVVLDSL